MGTVITAGCGISYKNFDQWPTWPKYCQLSHQCDHVNVGGPASGNEHIARSIVRAVTQHNPECVIVTWTNPDKLDVFVESADLAQRIKQFPSRNFLISWDAQITNAPANWPSSTSDDNDIKQWYKQNLESKTYYYIRMLESILSVQHICRLRSVPCYMFWGYPIEHDFAKRNLHTAHLYNLIDWSLFVTAQPLEQHYGQSSWFEYCTTGQHGLVPVAGWHWDFYNEMILPILDQHFVPHNQSKFADLKHSAKDITIEKFKQGLS
jgi:hypothetical protein